MRPLQLTLDGFRSYGEATTFEWEGRHLVGIVGPIGSGKSSILDGVAFALYGKTPRVERDVRSLIHQRRDEGKVSLTFEVDGMQWEAVRALRRKGASAHTLYRIVDGERHEEVDRAREMTERVTELLGLDWDAFRRSVLLAQNQFAGFLEATGTQRNEVLKGVFAFDGLDAMRDVVKGWLDEADRALAKLAALQEKAAADREDLSSATGQRTSLAERLERLEAVSDEITGAERERADVQRALEKARADMVRLGELAGRLPERERVEEVLGQAMTGAEAMSAAEAAVASAREAADAAASRRSAIVELVGGAAVLDEAAALVGGLVAERNSARAAADASIRAGKAVTDAGNALRSAEQSAVTLVGSAADAEAALDQAGARVADARTALHEARHRSMAISVRSELVAGEPCPVCLQEVAAVPPGDGDPDVGAADAALQKAETAEAAARTRATAAAADLAGVRTTVEQVRTQEQAALAARDEAAAVTAAGQKRVAEIETRLGGMLGDGDPEEVLGKLRSELAAADEAVAETTGGVRAALNERDTAAAAAAKSREAVAALATEVAAIGALLDVDVDAPAEPVALGRVLDTIRGTWVDANKAAEAAAAGAAGRLEQISTRRGEFLLGAGLQPDADFSAALTAAIQEVATIDARIALLQERLADLDRLETSEQETLERRAMLDRLHGDLAPSRFQAFVLDEYRRALAELGSEQFEVLSGGRYRFSDDGAFDVVDLTAAEQTRSADSLSGGETFLASLALALALAEMVSRQGGRLDAFFLDEGFGSLDAEHLDLAMEGVERLVAGADRLVVVVSHVAALQERLEDLIRLDKDPLSGTTRVQSGAGPAR